MQVDASQYSFRFVLFLKRIPLVSLDGLSVAGPRSSVSIFVSVRFIFETNTPVSLDGLSVAGPRSSVSIFVPVRFIFETNTPVSLDWLSVAGPRSSVSIFFSVRFFLERIFTHVASGLTLLISCWKRWKRNSK